MELKDLTVLRPELDRRGISVVTVLVDPLETPDTVEAARVQLAQNPLPFPVVMMVPALRDGFKYEGFPATYFIQADGSFSTTLLGYQPLEQVQEAAATIAPPATAAPPIVVPPAVATPAGAAGAHPPWEKHPLRALVPTSWAQWHPLVVHFPIALLVLEGALVCALLVLPDERVAR